MKRSLQLITIPVQETVGHISFDNGKLVETTYKYNLLYVAMPNINPERVLWNERQSSDFSDKDIEWDDEGNLISDGRKFVFGEPRSKPLKVKLQPWAFEFIKKRGWDCYSESFEEKDY
jgi:hypothetical protein